MIRRTVGGAAWKNADSPLEKAVDLALITDRAEINPLTDDPVRFYAEAGTS